ncbi:calcium ion binding protein [Aureococcus anophagefferens]|nr:calcium ion binding protein [Aureococcus anophagefferens]
MRGVVLASLLAAARGAASWNESYVDGLLHAGAVAKLSGTKAWLVCAEPPRSPFEDAEAKLDRCASYDDVEMAGRACETLTLGPGDARDPAADRGAVGGESVHLTLQRAGARPACGDVDEEAGYGAALRAAGAGRARRHGGRRRGWAGLDALAAPATLTVGAGDALRPPSCPWRRGAPAGGCAGLRAVFGAFAAFDDEAACAAAAAFAAALTARAPSPSPRTATGPRVAVERGALADVAVDGASRGAAADDFFAAVAAAAPAASGPLAKLRVRGQGRDGAVATFAVDDGSVEVGLAAPRGALPQVLDCVAESGVVDASRDGATGLRVTLAASGAVTGAATVTSAAGGDVALARRRALQTTTWRVGNACAVGTYGSGYECASCNEECDVQHWSGAYYEYSCDSGCTSCASCPECEPGTYQPYTAQTYCYSCPTGTYAPSNGLTACTVCEVGKYAMAAGSCACTLCEPGTYAPATETVLCTECEAGRYQSAFGATTCYDCPEGFFCPTQADGATACPAGKYSGANAEDCISCPDGYYSDADCDGDDADACSGGITSCEPCAAGTYPSTSNACCISCDAGTYSPGGQETCTECPAGAYCGTGSSSYTICEAGNEDAGSTACDDCAAGTFASGVGNSDCNVCYAGTYSLGAAATCAHCPAQTSLADEGTAASAHDSEDDCLGCGEGLWCASGGCHECTDCELCTNENHEPTFAVGDATLDLGAVDENGGFAIIGELGASDIENDYLDYVITAGDDAGLFSAANNILYVVADAGLDFETATSYTLTIEATEAYTTEQYSATVTVLVTVNDVNDIAMTAASPSTLSVVGGEAVVITGANLALRRRRGRRPSGIATADGTAITMLPTIGGTTMVVAGANFGAADDLASVSVDMHANQGDGDGWVDLEDCAITVDHTEITCVLRSGRPTITGARRAGLTSDASTVLTKYAPPTVTGVSGALTISSTAGGATIYVHGDNFGLTWMESSLTYALARRDLYSGTCSVTVKHERAACTTGPGTGSGHALKFTLWGQESVVFDAARLRTPYITSTNFYSSDPDRDGFLTAGGEKIVVHGGNFGADDSKIDAVTFGPSGYEYQTCDADGAYGARAAAASSRWTTRRWSATRRRPWA